jgi:hypothetical protein
MHLIRPRLDQTSVVVLDEQRELSTLLGHVNFVNTRGCLKVEGLDETAERKVQKRHGNDDSRAASTPSTEGEEIEVIPTGLNVGIEKPFRLELLRLIPMSRVVANPPCVDKDLALSWNVIASQLGLVEIHVGHKQGNCHVQPHDLLNHCSEVGGFACVRLGNQIPSAQHAVQLGSHPLLDAGVVDELSHPPFNGPQCSLNGCASGR